MRPLLVILMLTAAANAETLFWCGTGRPCILAPVPCTHPSGVCPLEELVMPAPGRVIPDNGVTISNSPQPKCDDGWSPVLSGNRPMCARELREPK